MQVNNIFVCVWPWLYSFHCLTGKIPCFGAGNNNWESPLLLSRGSSGYARKCLNLTRLQHLIIGKSQVEDLPLPLLPGWIRWRLGYHHRMSKTCPTSGMKGLSRFSLHLFPVSAGGCCGAKHCSKGKLLCAP